MVVLKEVVEETKDQISNKTSNILMDKDLCVVEDSLEAGEVLEEVDGNFKEMMQKMKTRLHVGSVEKQVILNVTVGVEATIKGNIITMHLQVEV